MAKHKRTHRQQIKHDWYLRNREAQFERVRQWRKDNREKAREMSRSYWRVRRERAIQMYGGKCICCGESHYEFLSFDHKRGGGKKHVQSLGGNTHHLVAWVLKKFRKSIQILCHNCNQAKGFYGYCPHQVEFAQA